MLKKIIVLIGAPGSGKGYYAQWLQKEYHLGYISSGDICRDFASRSSDLGKKIAQIVKRGDLINDDLITQLIITKINETNQNFVLDGFPRNLQQLNNWNKLIQDHNWKIIYLVLSCDLQICKNRIETRLICSQCNFVYNTRLQPPLNKNICNFDQTPLMSRADNEKIKHRFSVFEKETKPLITNLMQNAKIIKYELNTNLSAKINFVKLKKII